MNDELAATLEGFWPGRIELDVDLARLTTLGIGGAAGILATPATVDELVGLVEGCRDRGIPWCVIGGGSNLLVADEGVAGLVILVGRDLAAIRITGKGQDGCVMVEVEAGCSLAALLNRCIDEGLAGLEFLAGIPGTVGGAVAMNAGAWGREVKDVLSSLSVLEEGGLSVRSRKELVFGYRSWQGPPGAVIVAATFNLEVEDRGSVEERCRVNIAARRGKQPTRPSAGSFFKNPPQAPAGRLIEEAGLKGTRIGGAQVSEVHANFLVNSGGATAADMVALVKMVRARVRDVHGIDLEPEVRFLGFADGVLNDEK